MKYTKTSRSVLMWLLTAMFITTLTGCTDSPEDKKTISEYKMSIRKVNRETRDLIEVLEAYTADQRKKVIERTQKALDELDKRVNALETRLDNDCDQINKATHEKNDISLKTLREQRAEVAEWYNRLETGSAENMGAYEEWALGSIQESK